MVMFSHQSGRACADFPPTLHPYTALLGTKQHGFSPKMPQMKG